MTRTLTPEQRAAATERARAWRRKYPERVAAKNREFIARQRATVRAAKSVPCADCGRRFPAAYMHFDHVRGEKSFSIGDGTALRSVGLKRLLEEIEKCDVRCPICHTARHLGHDPLTVWSETLE